MELSVFLAKVIGLYLILVNLAVLLKRREISALVEDFSKNRLFVFFSGGIILILGLLIVVSHNIWEISFRAVITLLGWLTVLKGIIRIFAPNFAQQASKRIVKTSLFAVILVIAFLVGVWLTYVGFAS